MKTQLLRRFGRVVAALAFLLNLYLVHRLEAATILVTCLDADQVLKYQVTGTTWTADGVFADSSSTLDAPAGVATDGTYVYVGEEKDGGRVLRYNMTGNLLGTVATAGVDFVGRPECIVVDGNGDLIMSVAFGAVGASDRIYRIANPSGAASVTTLVPTNFGSGTLDNPRGMEIVGDRLFVANRNAGGTSTGSIEEFVASTGAFTQEFGDFDNPQGLGVKGNNLLASVFTNADIFAMDVNGGPYTQTTATTIWDQGTSKAYIDILTVDNNIFYTEFTNSAILYIDESQPAISSASAVVSTGLNHPVYMTEIPIPEPSTCALAAIGLSIFGCAWPRAKGAVSRMA